MNTSADPNQMLTLDEAADLLSVEKHHLRKLIDAGVVPSVRLSPRIVRVPLFLLRERMRQLAGAVENADGGSSVLYAGEPDDEDDL